MQLNDHEQVISILTDLFVEKFSSPALARGLAEKVVEVLKNNHFAIVKEQYPDFHSEEVI